MQYKSALKLFINKIFLCIHCLSSRTVILGTKANALKSVSIHESNLESSSFAVSETEVAAEEQHNTCRQTNISVVGALVKNKVGAKLISFFILTCRKTVLTKLVVMGSTSEDQLPSNSSGYILRLATTINE